MEDLSKRFPSLIPMILQNVDDKTLGNFKETNREMNEVLENTITFFLMLENKLRNMHLPQHLS